MRVHYHDYIGKVQHNIEVIGYICQALQAYTTATKSVCAILYLHSDHTNHTYYFTKIWYYEKQ